MGCQTPLLLFLFAGVLALSSAQNGKPEWVDTSITDMREISEATKINEKIGTLKCVDPDGDPVQYRLTSGTAVRVRGTTGEVFLAVSLDFEKTDDIAYDLTFECYDVDRTTGREINAGVEFRTVISPNDANDNPPEFSVASNEGYSFFIREDVPIGTELTPAIQIRDKDRANNAVLDKVYFVCNSDIPAEREDQLESSIETCSKFQIIAKQENEGVYSLNLTTTALLDYEARRVYSSKLIAIDGGASVTPKLTTTVNIQINVQDAQDVGPLFTNRGTSASVSERAPIGSTVPGFSILARDGDFGDRRPVRISIIKDDRQAFNLTDSTLISASEGIYESRLIVNNQLDREAIGTAYEIIVKVTELNTTGQETMDTATATYSIFVSDFNDNPPTFSQDIYYVNVTELGSSVPVQINGFRIDVSDPDEPTNARYRVSVVEESFQTYSVTPNLILTGDASIFLQVGDARYLDYDNPLYREQRVVLVARETGTSELLSSSTTVSISLRDINDNSPVFGQAEYTAAISESVNTFPFNFMNISATDKDSGINGRVEYRLEGETSDLFRVDRTTGRLFLAGPVDFETSQQYVFLAYAYDLAESSRQTQVQVTVNIINFNDEGPRFLLPRYQTSVRENERTFFNPVNVTAVDSEEGTTRITYRIVSGQTPNNAFLIDPDSGVLSLRDNLNYEGTPVGPDGQFTGQYILEIEASDNGSPPQTNTVNVVITVIDVNDHSPVLSPKTFSKELSELAPAGTHIVTINGTDDDGGVFGTISYRIGRGLSDNFLIDPVTGKITVGENRNFNYNIQDKYELQIIGSDGGAPQRSATAIVFIDILDGNNQPPEFTELIYYVSVDEKTPVNTEIRKIQALDSDSDSNLRYSILDTGFRATNADGQSLSANSAYDYKNAFGVDNEGGIFVKNPLDRESANEISFALLVEDLNTKEGVPTATTQVTVLITGQASTNITFDRILTVYMNEDAKEDYNAITLTARDPNNNAVQNYAKVIEPGTSSNFDVSRDGRVTLRTEVDYENDPQPDHLHRVVVRAVSNDGTQSATTTATISVVDVNDNLPVFSPAFYEAEVPETNTYPMVVTSIFATDADSRSYGPLEFSIIGGLDSDDFDIFTEDPGTGARVSRRAEVIVARGKTLDYNRRSEYNLDISVVDNANIQFSTARLTNNAKLIIRVVDENNNRPEFVESTRALGVAETAPVDMSIATLRAFDKDVGQNGEIMYGLEAANNFGLDLFDILPRTGVVVVKKSLLGRGGQVFSFRVRARDQGDRPNSGYMDLTISVQSTEDDDGNPKWNYPSNKYELTAPEETPGYVLQDNGRTMFFDVVPRTGTEIRYALSDAGDFANSFQINAVTGEITITASLDREIRETYEILVYAEDTSSGDLRSGRQLIVRLLDKDDNLPTFTNPRNYAACQETDLPLIIQVPENSAADKLVFLLRACDPDAGSAAAIRYELYNDNAYCQTANQNSILRLNSATGGLLTKEVVDYEQKTEYQMCVRALPVNTPPSTRKKRSFDLGQVGPTQDNVVYIQINIIDENDNGPRFPSPTEVASVRTQPSTNPIFTMNAVDPDGSTNNVVLYRVVNSVFVPRSGQRQVAADVFEFRGTSGALFPALQSYQSFAGGRFELTIRASDERRPDFNDDLLLSVFVTEEGHAMKVVLGNPPSTSIYQSSEIIRKLNEIDSRYSFQFLQVSEHRTDDGVDPESTDLCFLAVNTSQNVILNVRQVIGLLDSVKYRDLLSQSNYNQIDRGTCYPSQSSEKDVKWRDLWWVLVAVAIFIFICCLILIILVVLLHDKYRRYMKTRQTYLVGQ